MATNDEMNCVNALLRDVHKSFAGKELFQCQEFAERLRDEAVDRDIEVEVKCLRRWQPGGFKYAFLHLLSNIIREKIVPGIQPGDQISLNGVHFCVLFPSLGVVADNIFLGLVSENEWLNSYCSKHFSDSMSIIEQTFQEGLNDTTNPGQYTTEE